MTAARRAVLLPWSCEAQDPASVTWSRGLPLLLSEELRAVGHEGVSFAAWTSGQGDELRLVHLPTAPPVGHVAAFARAAAAPMGISGWATWGPSPSIVLAAVPPSAQDPRKHPVPLRLGSSRVVAARRAYRTLCAVLGVASEPPPVLLATEADGALLSWLQDLLARWFERRRGRAPGHDCRNLLSALGQDPDFEPASLEILRRCGQQADDEQGRQEASTTLQALLRLRPSDHLAWTLLGMLLRRLQRTEIAEQALRRAVSLAPDYGPGHRELGGLLMDCRQYRPAGAHLRRAGKLGPRDPAVHFALGRLYLKLKDRSRAVQHLRAVLKLAGGTPIAVDAAGALRDIEGGPRRIATTNLGAAAPRGGSDRALIARTFGLNLDGPTLEDPDFLADLDSTDPG